MDKITYEITDVDNNVRASFTVRPTDGRTGRMNLGQIEARNLMSSLRSLPSDLFIVEASYPLLGNEKLILNRRSIKMDLALHIPSKEETSKGPRRSYFVAPAPQTMPDDGIMSYFTVESIYDIEKAPDRSVLLFSPESYAILAVLTGNTKVFDLNLTLLAGLPEAEYNSEFEKHVWNLDRASYSVLVSDIKAAADTAELLAATEASTHDREKAQYTRKDGSVKAFEDFVIGGDTVEDEE